MGGGHGGIFGDMVYNFLDSGSYHYEFDDRWIKNACLNETRAERVARMNRLNAGRETEDDYLIRHNKKKYILNKQAEDKANMERKIIEERRKLNTIPREKYQYQYIYLVGCFFMEGSADFDPEAKYRDSVTDLRAKFIAIIPKTQEFKEFTIPGYNGSRHPLHTKTFVSRPQILRNV